MSLCLWRAEVKVGCLSLLVPSYILRQGLSQNLDLIILARPAASKPLGGAGFCLTSSTRAGITTQAAMPGLCLGVGDLDSGSQVLERSFEPLQLVKFSETSM